MVGGKQTTVEWLHKDIMPLERESVGALAKLLAEGEISVDESEIHGMIDFETARMRGGRPPRRSRAKSRVLPTAPTKPSLWNLDLSIRAVQIVDNRALFGAPSVILYAFVLDGRWNPNSGFGLAQRSFSFPKVEDGAMLPIGPTEGVTVYEGTPKHFLNVHIIAVKDTTASREFAKILKDKLSSESVATLLDAAEAALGVPALAAPEVRKLAMDCVSAALESYSNRGNPIIGVFYESLTGARKKGRPAWGAGLHPSNYPPDMIECGRAMKVAYEVITER